VAAPVETAVIVLNDGGDYDGDGLINIDETVSGTDPVSASSVFKLNQTIEGPERKLQLSWPVAAGRHYTLMERSSLGTAGTWTAVAEYDAADATNGVVVVPVSAPSDAQRFYCLKVTQP
jgi:hypothetical protein